MPALFNANKTSAQLLADFAADAWGKSPSEPLKLRYLMVFDLFIKARSYALLNKFFFGLALLAGSALLVWPVIAFKLDSIGVGYSAMVQTSVTGLAALLFALYSHYKKRQTYAENLMRHVIFSNEALELVFEKVQKEMERMDQGFVFSETLAKKNGSDAKPAD
ncbi:hypothetical protein NP590_12225 [Methylomonas sp. SURF-2]|uniref:DUF4231 domain-containing protein n=1 Tax=Methylomonas subterranea TaxID=2952225 RepID=A0ABT1THR7_9GAMM|nr:hypothetical protein [Methylomonas sp. SURF-2]MCQ8104874.1 hypothetical protein [Methylomonas sp. SURF-2]